MTAALYRQYRAAMQTPARFLIVSLERRGAILTVNDAGRLLVSPARVLTDADRLGLRAHADAAKLLVRHRRDWYDWATRPVPAFAPSRAFLTSDEIRGQSA